MVKWSDIKPSFLSKSGGGKSNKLANRASASKDLSAAEFFASNNPASKSENTNKSTEDVFNAESESDSLYTGSGRSRSNGKTKGKGFFKKGGALTVIIATFFGGGALLFGSTSLLGSHLQNLFTEATDTQYPSFVLRSNRLFSYMLDGGEQIKNNPFTGTKKYTTFTPYMKSRLEKNGIEVGHINADTGDFESGDLLSGKSRALQFTDSTGKTSIITADDFAGRYATDVEFREAYYKAKRGRVGCFFDDIADKFYKKLGLSRNVFDDFKKTGDTDTDDAEYKKKVAGQFGEDGETDVGTRRSDLDEDGNEKYDDNGKKQNVSDDASTKTEVDVDVDPNADAEVKAKAKAKAKAEAYVNKLSTASAVANGACALMKIGAAISVAVAANEIYQAITYYQTNIENTSKAMAGEGDESAINEFLNFMTEPSETETTDFSSANASISSYTDGSTVEAATTKQSGAPIEAEGMKLVLGSGSVNQTSLLDYSLERINVAFTTTTASFVSCGVVQAGAAVVSIVSTVMSFGISTIVESLIQVGAGIAIGLAVAWLVPTIAQALFSDPSTLTGIPAGEMMAKGAEAANSKLHREGSGGSPSSEDQALAYNKATQEVLALEAEIDRKNYSPFDITNKNTFLGSIFSSFYSLALTSGSSSSSVVSSFSNLASSSLATLMPATYADGKNTSYQTTFGKCDILESIGAVGDIYCNPITTSDTSTIDVTPDDPKYAAVLQNNISDAGTENEKVKKLETSDSLYSYINYCTERSSPFGVVDANILGSMNPTSIDNSTASSIVGAIPLVGDVIDLIESEQTVANLDWATGKKCVSDTEEDSWWNTTGKYYQRYIEDSRILEQMGAIETNPVTVAKEEFLKDHPLDNSDAGYLSRIAGITKDDAETVLALAEYYTFLADYEPSELYAFGSENDGKTIYDFDSEGRTYIALLNPIIYNDIRNRSYAAC